MHEPSPQLPEWLASVPMELLPQTSVPIGDSGRCVSAELLAKVLNVDIGKGIGAISMSPELAQRAAELSENPNWKNLAPEPTLVFRNAEDDWEIRVGDFAGVFTRQDLISALGKALHSDAEGEIPEV
ncbi:MAG TPA: hypothetical protein VLG16_00920 [Candidatus Saccharimonadales bacterium]|nr:hypothetical protein [Candidatus Saccharimonadales bacterium]